MNTPIYIDFFNKIKTDTLSHKICWTPFTSNETPDLFLHPDTDFQKTNKHHSFFASINDGYVAIVDFSRRPVLSEGMVCDSISLYILDQNMMEEIPIPKDLLYQLQTIILMTMSKENSVTKFIKNYLNN